VTPCQCARAERCWRHNRFSGIGHGEKISTIIEKTFDETFGIETSRAKANELKAES